MVHETVYMCCLYELCHCLYICCVSTYVYAHQLHMFYSTCLPMYINVCAVLCVYVQNKPYSAYHSYIHIHICIRSFVGTLLNHLDVNAQYTCMIRMYIIYKHMQS